MTTMKSNKSVSETLQDLRALFDRYDIEEWEPIRSEQDVSYAVRYRQGQQWVNISSRLQVTRAANLRQCHQVIQYLFLWASRGVGGVSQGVTFIGQSLVRVGEGKDEDTMAEAYATLGVEATSSLDEIGAIFGKGSAFYRWLKQQGYPPGIRVLCFNCNCALGLFGYCPHGTIKVGPEMVITRNGHRPASSYP
mgnify:CR=1 FL=1